MRYHPSHCTTFDPLLMIFIISTVIIWTTEEWWVQFDLSSSSSELLLDVKGRGGRNSGSRFFNAIEAFPIVFVTAGSTTTVSRPTSTVSSTNSNVEIASSSLFSSSLSSSNRNRHRQHKPQQRQQLRTSWQLLLSKQRGGATANVLQTSSSSSSSSLLSSSIGNNDITSSKRQPQQQHLLMNSMQTFMNKNFFVVGMVCTVLLAYLFPALGTTGGILHPELWLNQYGVSYVFLMSGLSIQLAQMKQATYNMKLNLCIQLILFVVWPLCMGVPIQYLGRTLLATKFSNIISQPLFDGILVLSCLPTTVNMCVILTSTAGGNVASALCNAVLSNMAGIVITPLLLFRFFGSDISLPLYDMVLKLMKKVLLPVVIGQVLRAQVPFIKKWYYQHEKILKRSQEIILLGILWNAFCTAITSQLGVNFQDGMALLTLLPVIHILALAGTFAFFSLPILQLSRGEIIAAMFCSSQKTLAFGLPLIQTIFEGNANLAIYSAPLMIIHPIQLMIGSILVPRIERYIQNEKREAHKINNENNVTE